MKPAFEKWKAVVEFPGYYQVSNWGRVRTVKRKVLKRNGVIQTVFPRLRKTHSNLNGYRAVTLNIDGHYYRRLVSHLVALAFLGPRPTGHDVAHLNGNLAHNWLTNLAYKTRKENMAQTKEHGTYSCGQDHHRAKLKNSDIPAIRKRLLKEGYSEIAEDYGVSPAAIRNIFKGRSWVYF